MGAAVQPDIKLNGEKVKTAKPHGFYFMDRDPGNYEVTAATGDGEEAHLRPKRREMTISSGPRNKPGDVRDYRTSRFLNLSEAQSAALERATP